MENKTLITIVRWLIVPALPFLLGLGTIRAIIAWDAPSYPEWEYGRIASDRFGFSDEERLELALGTMDYLRRSEPASEVIYLLEDLRLPGTDDPLYNEREIGHMIDVKVVADQFKQVVWVTAVVVIGGLIFLLARPATRPDAYKALFHGGLLTTIILVVIGLFILVGWSIFFEQFHNLLFPPGTWTFSYSDSLIRLFPEQFWFDFGVLTSGLVLLEGVLVAVIGYVLLKRAPI